MVQKIKLHQNQYEVWEDKHRFKVICAGRRWGKSTLALTAALMVMASKPNMICAVVAPTFQQAKDIYWRDPMKIPSIIPPEAIAKKNDSELFIQLKHTGSYLYLKGSDRPDTLRGLGLDFVVLDEYAQMKAQIWEQIVQPALLDKKGHAMFISTPFGYDKFWKLWKRGQGGEKEWKSWRYTSFDNPHNSAEDLERWKKEYDPDTFAQEYLAEFKKLSGSVYKDFDRDVHVIKPRELSPYIPHYRAIDFGYVNPAAVLFVAIDGGNIYIYDEIYRAGMSTPELADTIRQRSVGQSFLNTIADSAQRSDIEELQKYGLGVYGVSKTSGSKNEDWTTHRIRRVAEKLRNKKLFIFNNCKNLIYEFEHYVYCEIKEGERIKEIPLKLNDHALDALSYLVTSLPEKVEPEIMDYDTMEVDQQEDKDWSFTK